MPAILFAYTTALAAGTTIFGWNLAELNAPQNAIQEDLGLGAAQFGLASSILAIGGLVGSGLATPGMNALGRKKILVGTAIGFGVAGSLKAVAGSAAPLTLGRFVGGIASGSAAVIVPIYINELAPPTSKGAFGALTQISINLGILSSQAMGILLENKGQWRFILLTGGIIGFLQAIALPFLPESPTSLVAAGKMDEARRVLTKIRGTPDIDEELASYRSEPHGQPEATVEATVEAENTVGQDPLLVAEAGQSRGTTEPEPAGETTSLLGSSPTPEAGDTPIGLMAFVMNREYRSVFVIVAGVMLAQQLTGINSVVFYGVSILNDLLPKTAKFINVGISAVNLFVTLGASFWFDRVSDKALLLGSALFMGVSAIILAVSILYDLAGLSAISTLLFVMSFSMGLGPLPWMVASRRIAQKAVGAAQSIALVANWMGTFLVGFAVPVIADAAGMHIVFAMFAAFSFFFFGWGVYYL